MIIPESVQRLLNKNKILETTETDTDFVYWLQPSESYEEPTRINQLAPNWEMHIVKKPHIIRFIK